MATYPAGDLTKEKLYETAKEVFYEKGYLNATMKEVCRRADVKQSVFYYHFKDKSALSERLYTDFGEKHMGIISQEIVKHDYTRSVIINNCVSTALFFMNTLEEPNLNRFWGEMYLENIPSHIGFYRHRYANMYKKCQFDVHGVEFDFFLISCTSINGLLLKGYYDKTLHATAEEIVRYKVENILLNLKFSQDAIRKTTDQIIAIAKKIPVSAGQNFKIYLDGKEV